MKLSPKEINKCTLMMWRRLDNGSMRCSKNRNPHRNLHLQSFQLNKSNKFKKTWLRRLTILIWKWKWSDRDKWTWEGEDIKEIPREVFIGPVKLHIIHTIVEETMMITKNQNQPEIEDIRRILIHSVHTLEAASFETDQFYSWFHFLLIFLSFFMF